MKRAALLLVSILLVAAASESVGTSARDLGTAIGGQVADGHRRAPVVVIVMENHNYGEIVGNGDAHYLNNRFIPAGRLFTNYHAIEHPSLPNYLAMTSGTTSGCHSNDCPVRHFRTNNIFHQLAHSGRGWRTYAEGMPSRCALEDSGRYVVHHNPPPYYRKLRGLPCRRFDRPYPTPLPSRLVAFTFVVPDECHDMHDCSVAAGDRWLRHHVPALLNRGAIVVITFDEASDSNSNRVLTAAVGPGIRAGVRRGELTHYSLLAGIEVHFGLGRLHHARDARVLHL